MNHFLSTIPAIIRFGSIVLVAGTIGLIVYMRFEASRLQSWMRQFLKAMAPFLGDGSRRDSGLEHARYEAVRKQGNSLKSQPRKWWERVENSMELYTSPEEKESWFTLRPIREVLSFDEIISNSYHQAFHASVPGMLTGIGLLLTFVAILLALAGVTYDKTNVVEPVTGMEGLINGLSGKFLSSIVALALSVVFTLAERVASRGLRRQYENLIAKSSAIFPYLSPSRILLDIQRFSSKQTVSVSHISAEVVDRFVGEFKSQVSPALAEGVSTGMALQLQNEFRPTMQQMNNTLSELRSAIVSLESQKQESIAGEFRGLLRSLEDSMVNTLGKMGSDFHNALTGAASQEFGNVQGTLEGTRQMLSEMNSQFGRMHEAFAIIVGQAENATKENLSRGREQSEAMTAVMQSLMVKLQQSAEDNVGAIRKQLTIVVGDLSDKVSNTMSTSISIGVFLPTTKASSTPWMSGWPRRSTLFIRACSSTPMLSRTTSRKW